ncbi:MAG: caspase family protein [SAR324 cluster bacterium]|nr:caspase family protein [SAR324 cluster bacterium]
MKKFGRFLILVVVLTGAFFIQANGTQHQKSARDFRAMTPEALLLRSWSNPSILERAEIRKFLAENHPNTQYGLFAKAWVASNEGKKKLARRIYRSCLSRYPDFLHCRYNLTFAISDPTEKIEHFKFILRREPAFNDYRAIRSIYFKYLDDLKNKEKADAFLAGWEKRLEKIYIFDFIRGLEARYNEKNYRKAEGFYQGAINKEGATFEVYSKLTDLRIKRLSSAQSSVKKRSAHLELINSYSKKWRGIPGRKAKINVYSALVYMGGIFHNVFKAERLAARAYRSAFAIYPTGEAMEKYSNINLIKNDLTTQAIRVLRSADERLPDNHLIKMRLGNLMKGRDLKAAENYFQQALDAGPTLSYKVKAAINLGNFIYEKNQLNFSKARALYLSLLDRGGNKNSLLSSLYYNRKAALDFESAKRYLTEQEEFLQAKGTISRIWFTNRKNELNLLLAAEKRAKKKSEKNQLLELWEEKFGPSLKLKIGFSAGKADIPAGNARDLEMVATLLSLPVAKNNVILIEGHIDPSEQTTGKEEGPTAQGEEELSLRRARAVARLLNRVHGVSLEKIKIAGVKDRYPLRPSNSKTGRGVNRRVEITLAGNAAKPEISITTALDASAFALSPNGRFMSAGYYPVQIWDVNSGVKLMDLGRGGAKRKFSPNNRYLAVISSFEEAGGYLSNVLYVYDVFTGNTVVQIAEDSKILLFDWNPQSTQIVYATADARMVIFDLKTRKHIAVRESYNRKNIRGLLWSLNGKYIYSGDTQRTIRVWDAKTLAGVKQMWGVNWVHAMGQTHDGRYLAVADNRRILTVYDTSTWSVRRLRIPALGRDIFPHPFKPWVIINDFGGKNHKIVLLVDLSSMKILARRDAGTSWRRYAFSPDGTKLYENRGGKVLVLDPLTLKPVSEITGMSVQGKRARKDIKNNNLLTQDANGIHVWSLQTGRKIHFWAGKFSFFGQYGKDSGRFLAAVENEKEKFHEIYTLDTGTYQKKLLLKLNYVLEGWAKAGDRLVVLGKPYTKPEEGSKIGFVEVYSLNGNSPRRKFRFDVPLVTEYLRYPRLGGSGFSTYDVDAKGGKIILATYWGDGWRMGLKYSKQARIFDLKSGKKLKTIHVDSVVKGVYFHRKDKNLVTVVLKSRAKIYDRGKGTFIRVDLMKKSGLNIVDLPQSKGKLYWSLNLLEKVTPEGKQSIPIIKENIASVQVFEDRNLLVVLTLRNEIEFYDLKTLKKRLTIISKNDNQWIAFNPDGVFSSSARGTQKVFWAVGSLRLDFKALKARNEKPKWIAKLMKNLFSKQKGVKNGSTPIVPQTSNKPEPDLFILPYSLTMTTPAVVETDQETFLFKLRVEKIRANFPDAKIVFTQQGQQISGRGVAVVKRPSAQKFSGGKYSIERNFKLAVGMNVIQASLIYRNARLLTQTVIVNRKAGKASNMRGVHLWYLGIGVSEYSNPDFNLKYADADVIALEKTFKKQEGVLFKKVNTKLLLNSDVTAKNIKLAMHRFLKKASDQDVVIIFLAGHGIQDNDQTLYFMTHDSDLNEPYTGVDLDFFHKFLRKRPLNQKAIVLLDICQSGAFGRSEKIVQRGRITAEDAVKQLADGTGLLVLASSTGKEYSLEDKRFGGGHGAFSSAVIEAFDNGKADKMSGDRNGVVSVLEMFNYVSRRVPEITENKQHPTMPIVRNLRDFPLARY